MHSMSRDSSPLPVLKPFQSIDPIVVSVHNEYPTNVRMVCIQSETGHSTAFYIEFAASLDIMPDFAHESL